MRFESGQHQRLPFRGLPAVVAAFSGKGPGAVLPGNEKVFEFPFDAPKLERVISNLLENASKFTPSGGTVWLHAEPYMWERRSSSSHTLPQERRRRPLSQPNSVKISVSDTGPGVHRNIIWKFLMTSSACPRKKRKVWVWGWRSRADWSTAMGGKVWVES